MKELFTGIYSKYNGNEALKAAITGFYFTEAPQDAAMPYVVYNLVSNVPDWTYTEDMENSLIQFSIFDDHSSSTTINDIYEKLTALFDWCVLTIEGYSHIYMKREFNILTRGNDIWKYVIQYRNEVQK